MELRTLEIEDPKDNINPDFPLGGDVADGHHLMNPDSFVLEKVIGEKVQF